MNRTKSANRSKLYAALVTLVLCVSVSIYGSGADKGLDITIAKDQFKLYLPDDWEEVPESILVELWGTVSEDQRPFDFAFQPSASEYWLDLPYVTVQVIETGWLPEAVFADTEKVQQYLKVGSARVSEQLGQPHTMDIANVSYDRGRHLLRYDAHLEIPGQTELTYASAELLTINGVIRLYCYSVPEQYDELAPLFDKIIAECDVHSEFEYISRVSETDYAEVPGPPSVLGYIIVAGLWAGLIACAVIRHRYMIILIKWTATVVILIIMALYLLLPGWSSDTRAGESGKQLGVVLCGLVIGALWVVRKGRVVRWVATLLCLAWTVTILYYAGTGSMSVLYSVALVWSQIVVLAGIWLRPKSPQEPEGRLVSGAQGS